jgi:hypothetical protein
MASTARQRWLALTPKERARIVHETSTGGAVTDYKANGKRLNKSGARPMLGGSSKNKQR